ncbi:S8 family serine peptidase [Kitasatospora sp. YST-16]|uniref:S8 family serine peptidase n=1 Tax=Kitasatospora sp. YST-16 TaxID=2998080 RepID=UPI002284419D|nr:S8 family serine peptidase [Kitasatospora sp. YST-16]WAL71990.1 S8 family serine peptidase [Kitasatospora sp. YST-16]WNW38037.1 S8 family serine peptidase [Streptomyces sp. Li-HN-5-13]
MTHSRITRTLGTAALTAGILLGTLPTAPAASADQVRDGQWANSYFGLDKVWSVSKGDGVTVAVIDTGVKASHPDLTGSLLPGYDPGGQGREIKPTSEHGTGMASLIAGHGHGNGEGVVGLAPGAKILPVYRGEGNTMPQGIEWAVDHGAKVINISQVTTTSGPEDFVEAVSYALQHKVLVVAGSGNNAGAVRTPANTPGVLAVGAVDKNQKIWGKSNYGPELMLTAPGVGIVTAAPETVGSCRNPYCIGDGTSVATAYVSAAAALVFAKYPDLTPGQVANRLVKTATVPAGVSQLPDARYGYGTIHPYEALTKDIPPGPAQGPLAASADTAATDSTGQGPDGHRSDPAVQGIQQPSSGLSLPLIAGIGGGAVALLIVVIVVAAVASSRKRRRAQPLPYQPGPVPPPHTAPPGWPPAPPQQYAQQPYGPPPGYPQQQAPYQGPYQGGGR